MRYITKRDLPRDPHPCEKHECVYNDDEGICDEPFINYGNGDATCHGERPRTVLTWLGLREDLEAQRER